MALKDNKNINITTTLPMISYEYNGNEEVKVYKLDKDENGEFTIETIGYKINKIIN